MEWSKEEIKLLKKYVVESGYEELSQQICHAHHMLYLSGNHPEFKKRSNAAVRNKFNKLIKE